MPFVPGEIVEEEQAFARFEGGCILCATVEAELADGARVVLADDRVVAVAPFWSGTPYEMLVIPRQHEAHLQGSAPADLAARGSRHPHGPRPRSATCSATCPTTSCSTRRPHHHDGAYHWHAHIWPKLATTAGFERGTGVLINITPPELAAQELRRAVSPALAEAQA